ncbi:hypothetical protein J1N35_039883 [Gossypium stocksii]|uniref:Uncharacterized protein n=1 Tax=Gossypium stocksii TaxID=47602 RepID=A0A9D3ZH73_9ROSI|nr:hypothetical protein J1N35_039883 [Gossypium stocksii]
MLLPVIVTAALAEKILLPVPDTGKDVPPKILLTVLAADVPPEMPLPVLVVADVPPNKPVSVLVVADVPPKIPLPVLVVADVPPKIPLLVLVTGENVLLKMPLPEFVIVEDTPLELLFPELATSAVVPAELLAALVPPKILLSEPVKVDVLPKGKLPTLPSFVSCVLDSVASPEVADNVETEVDGSPEDENLKSGAPVKEGIEASTERLLVKLLLAFAVALAGVMVAAEESFLVAVALEEL